MSLSNCDHANNIVFTYNSGLYLEGLSVFASITNDSTLIDECVFHHKMKKPLHINALIEPINLLSHLLLCRIGLILLALSPKVR